MSLTSSPNTTRHPETATRCLGLAALLVIAGTAAGCGNDAPASDDANASPTAMTDETAAATGISDVEQWCSTIGGVDGLLAGDLGSDDFATAQQAAATAHGLLEQLAAASAVVDGAHRDAVMSEIEFGLAFTGAFVDAASVNDALIAAGRVGADTADDPSGPLWIEQTCGVDITD